MKSSQPEKQGCTCSNPIQAQPKNSDDWEKAHQRNIELVTDEMVATKKGGARPLDVLLLGDSIIEFWTGYLRGVKHPLKENARVYQDLFRSNTSAVKGLGLGVAGDGVVQLLYRLQNGEFPDELQVPVIWLLIGTNNLGHNRCNAETVTASILHVVALLRQTKPDAQVVINSILPKDQEPLAQSTTWKLITAVNERLECYVATSNHDNHVHFFNATEIFLTGSDHDVRVNHALMPDFLHPNAAGYQQWGNEIVHEVQRLSSRAKGPTT